MRRLIFWIALLVAIASLTQYQSGLPVRGAGERDDQPSMNVIAAGMNSRGTSMFQVMDSFDRGGQAKRQAFRIELEANYPGESRVRKSTGIVQYLFDHDDDPKDLKVIRIKGPDDPSLQGFIKAIAATPHATVNIDMDIVNLGEAQWKDQTDQLAKIAGMLATERVKQQPESRNSIFTHSAATLGLSKLMATPEGALFQTAVAASTMTRNLPQNVVIVQVANDLPSVEKGAMTHVPGAAIEYHRETSPSLNREMWANNTVIRISGRSFDLEPSEVIDSDDTAFDTAKKSVNAHMAASKPGVRDAEVEVFSPGEKEPIKLSNVSYGQVVKILAGNAGPSVQTNDRRRTEIDEFKDRVKALKDKVTELEPPKGGGIALKAVAELPVDPNQVIAVWEENAGRILLVSKDGSKTWRLPKIDIDIARTAYRCVFGENARDPEFSIGVDPLGRAVDSTAPGKMPTYFLGPVADTQFGLIMMRSDVALAEIAYGGSKQLSGRGLERIAGYHSLPEMFPAKYTDQPTRERWLGADERVVIQSLPTRLMEEGSAELVYVHQPELAVRFGRTTPAERAYADIFGTNYYAILEKVPEFRDLVQCSRAIGVFKWLKENGVSLTGGSSLEGPPPVQALTPAQVSEPELPKLEELSLLKPLVVYGEYGPTDIFRASGDHVEITYAHEHIKKITRGGSALNVYTDDQGNPIAFDVKNIGAAAFSYDTADYPSFHDDVTLQRHGDGTVLFQARPSSSSVPETDPWGIINLVAERFIRFGDQVPISKQSLNSRSLSHSSGTLANKIGLGIALLIAVALISGLIILLRRSP